MAYNPAADGNCEAWWRLGDDTNIVTDSSGKGNTLTNSGSVGTTATAWEGSSAGDFVASSSDWMQRADADLTAGFPLKSSGGATEFTVCFAVRFASLPASGDLDYLFAKYRGVTNGRSFAIICTADAVKAYFQVSQGYNSGNSVESEVTSSALSTGRWYHVGVTYSDSAKHAVVRIYDATAASVIETATLSYSNNIYLTTQPLALGANSVGSGFLDGILDDVVVFSRVLSSTEIDAVRAQTFPDGGLSVPVACHVLNQMRRAS